MLGDNLLSLIKAYSYRNIPLDLVKHITKQVINPFHDPTHVKVGLYAPPTPLPTRENSKEDTWLRLAKGSLCRY